MMRRIALLLLVLVPSILIATGCGEFGKKYSSDGDAKATPTGKETPVTDEEFDEAARKRDGCTELEEFESEGSEHTTDLKESVEYKHNPPHSGDHYQVAKEWGLYDSQQSDLETVHNLEHGHIVITHKGLSEKQEKTLLDHARINSYHLLVMPRKENPKDGVYYTAWTAQIYCEQPSKPALQLMIDEWRDAGPELFTDDPGMGTEKKDA